MNQLGVPSQNAHHNTNLLRPLSPLARSGSPSSTISKVDAERGYQTYVFTDKPRQQAAVVDLLLAQGFIPKDLVSGEVDWFYDQLGIEDMYYAMESPETIASHILSLYSEKIRSFVNKSPELLQIDFEKETDGGSIFIHSSKPGISVTVGPGALTERKLDDKFLNGAGPKAWRIESYRSEARDMRSYFVMPCKFPTPEINSAVGQTARNSIETPLTNIKDVSDPTFYSKASPNTLQIYQDIIRVVEKRAGQGPIIDSYQIEGKPNQFRIVVAYKRGTTVNFFSSLTDLYHYYGLYSTRKYVENFANGVTIISIYLAQKADSPGPPIQDSVVQILKEISLIYVYPGNVFFGGNPDAPSAKHAVQEAAYAQAGWVFVSHFANRLGPAYASLRAILDEKNPTHAEALNEIKKRFREETFTWEFIHETISENPELVRDLYTNFAMTHYPAGEADRLVPTLSYARLKIHQVLTEQELLDKIRTNVKNENKQQVFEAFLIFNKAVLKTNFYQPTKVALSFRLDPSFLPTSEYPLTPYGIFMVFGAEFRGFHVRFRDVARGGIRVVRSRDKEAYAKNVRSLFDENYGLASTQALKNKDIPEGGAKGIILPKLRADPDLCFNKYIDALCDLLIPGTTAGVKEPVTDLLGKPEILFFGPDENTAHLMDAACLHARARGAPWWKSATTGKSAEKLGGIPHDVYGMTSLSVRQYYLGALNKLGLREEDVRKVQTGGPDGDLGSNEILLSQDKTITIIDGSGVLHDPNGIDRAELIRLAKARVMIAKFDTSKLSSMGYRVLVTESDVKLPDGTVVKDGEQFRNVAHLLYEADVLIPCGGRPEAINVANVAKLFDSEGKPKYRIIVEGANLFITMQARLILEKHGVILYRDSSANKGGVTSSSLEVLAGLSLTEDEYTDLMIFKDGKPSEFYQAYAKDIQNFIIRCAAYEFEAIHAEYIRNNGTVPRTLISDILSNKLNDLKAELESSDLIKNDTCKRAVLSRAIPPTLLAKIGLDELLNRLSPAYVRALFASSVASTFIYQNGVNATMVEFYHYMTSLAT